MNPVQFALNPIDYGIPDRQQLIDLRIWDDHYHGFAADDQIKQHHEMMFYAERMGIERMISLDIGGTLDDPFIPKPHDQELRAILIENKDKVSGLTPVDPGFPEESLTKIEDWVRKGPCIGI